MPLRVTFFFDFVFQDAHEISSDGFDQVIEFLKKYGVASVDNSAAEKKGVPKEK